MVSRIILILLLACYLASGANTNMKNKGFGDRIKDDLDKFSDKDMEDIDENLLAVDQVQAADKKMVKTDFGNKLPDGARAVQEETTKGLSKKGKGDKASGSGSSAEGSGGMDDYDALLKSLFAKEDSKSEEAKKKDSKEIKKGSKEKVGSKEKKSKEKTSSEKERSKKKEKEASLDKKKGGNEDLLAESLGKGDSSVSAKPNLVKDLLESVKEKLKEGKSLDSSSKDSANAVPNSYRLKNIRSLVTPELLFALAKAGEEDTIVFAANGFPSSRLASSKDNVIRMDGLSIPTILKEAMKLISISRTSQFPLLLMKPAEKAKDPKIWSIYKKIIESSDSQKYQWAKLNRQKFYEEAKKAVAIIQTGESDPSASLIITKGRIMCNETGEESAPKKGDKDAKAASGSSSELDKEKSKSSGDSNKKDANSKKIQEMMAKVNKAKEKDVLKDKDVKESLKDKDLKDKESLKDKDALKDKEALKEKESSKDKDVLKEKDPKDKEALKDKEKEKKDSLKDKDSLKSKEDDDLESLKRKLKALEGEATGVKEDKFARSKKASSFLVT